MKRTLTVSLLLCLLILAILVNECRKLSNEEITCFAWKDSGGAHFWDNLVFGSDTTKDVILHADRRITVRDSLIDHIVKANSTLLIVRLPNGKEAEFRKLARMCK